MLVGAVSISQGNNENNVIHEDIIMHIALMEIEDIEIPNYWPFKRLKFEINNGSNKIIACKVSNFIDHLFIYPDFIVPCSSLSKTTLNSLERYWLIPRNLFDRQELDVAPMFCEDEYCNNVESAKEFMSEYQAEGVYPYVCPPLPEYPIIAGRYSQSI